MINVCKSVVIYFLLKRSVNIEKFSSLSLNTVAINININININYNEDLWRYDIIEKLTM